MPLHPPACCRAVHRRACLPTTPEAIWITDDCLSHTYRKFSFFCGGSNSRSFNSTIAIHPVRVTKRHGSHVPGPMESRRRTGKRRLVTAETGSFGNGGLTPPPKMEGRFSLKEAIWEALGVKKEDEFKWRWEPPSKRWGAGEGIEAGEPGAELPKWLTDHKDGGEELVGKGEEAVRQARAEEVAREVRADPGFHEFQAQIVSEVHADSVIQEIPADPVIQETEAQVLQDVQTDDIVHEFREHQGLQQIQARLMQDVHENQVSQASQASQVQFVEDFQKEHTVQDVEAKTIVKEVYEAEITQESAESKVMPVPNELDSEMRKEVREFRRLLKTTDDVPKLCGSFNRKVKEMLLLDSVPVHLLSKSFLDIITPLRRNVSSAAQVSTLSLRFLQAAWEGMTSGEVKRPWLFSDRVLREFLFSLMKYVEHSSEVEALAGSVLRLASGEQIVAMNHIIRNLVENWARSWMQEQRSFDFGPNVMDSPMKASALCLADVLNLLPRNMARSIVEDVTRTFRQEGQTPSNDSIRKLTCFCYAWLNVVARVKGVDESLLIDIWQAVDPYRGKRSLDVSKKNRDLCLSASCDVILTHWINCEFIQNPSSVVDTLDGLMVNKPLNQKFSCLIAALDANGELLCRNAKTLFHILRRLGLYSLVYEALKYLPDFGIKFPSLLLSGEITAIAPKNFNVAFKIYKIYPKIRAGRVCLTTILDRQHPQFYLDMINKLPAKDVWSLLRIPLYKEIWSKASSPRHVRGLKKLHPNRITLIRDMACEFAHAEHLRPRQARRNVTQCLMYLKLHRVSIAGKPDLTRAVVKAAISREMAMGKWIGTSTLQWVLRWVAIAEGEEVRDKLAQVLDAWRSEMTQNVIRRTAWERRDRNPLGVGPIS